jgi:hypothetical protein
MSCAHAGGPAAHLEALRRERSGRGWIKFRDHDLGVVATTPKS